MWKSIAFNSHVSNDLLKQIAEYDGGAYMKTFAAEKILAREQGFVGEKELRPIEIRGRVVRRQQAESGEPVMDPVAGLRGAVDLSALAWEDARDLSESKIYARWKKIIN